MRTLSLTHLITILALLLLPTVGQADLAQPTDSVILTVSGNIAHTNKPGKAEFDHTMLKALGVHQLRTTTPWTNEVIEFEGVLARDLMRAVGAKGQQIKATALNDYFSHLPMQDIHRYRVLLAFSMDGKSLTRRDKGPLWIIYPLDDHAELKERSIQNHLVWQLIKLEVQ